MKVEVYFNLHKRVFSVRSREAETRGRVVQHLNQCAIENPKFVVQQSGRNRVLREQRKYVHAYVRGVLSDSSDEFVKSFDFLYNGAPTLRTLTYNPYENSEFIDVDTEEPVHSARLCVLTIGDKKPLIRVV